MQPIKVNGYNELRIPLVQSKGKNQGRVFCHLPQRAGIILRTIAESEKARVDKPEQQVTRYELQGWRYMTAPEFQSWAAKKTGDPENPEYPDRINISKIDSDARIEQMREQDAEKFAALEDAKNHNEFLAKQNAELMERMAAMEAQMNGKVANQSEQKPEPKAFSLSMEKVNKAKDARTLKTYAAKLNLPEEEYSRLNKTELVELLTKHAA